MSLSLNLSTPSGQEKRKILQEYGFLVSKETEMQEDSRKCHQDSSVLRLKETEMCLSAVSPINTDEEAFLNSPNFSEVAGNQSSFSLDYNMNSQRSTRIKLKPRPRCVKNTSVEASNNSSGYGTNMILSHEQQLKQQNQNVAYDIVIPFEQIELSLFPNQYQNNAEEDHQILHVTSQSEQQQYGDSKEPNWTIKRVLNKSDVTFGGGKLFLQKKSFEKHILKHLSEEDKQKMVSNKSGIIVEVYDHDTGTTHELRMAFPKCYVLMGHWWKQFVKRRELIAGDKIGLFWECSTSTLHFRVLARAISSKAPAEI